MPGTHQKFTPMVIMVPLVDLLLVADDWELDKVESELVLV